MNFASTKAILLKTVPYKDKDRIIQALTIDAGIQSFYVKQKTIAIPSMLEIQYKKRSSIQLIVDFHELKGYEHIRTDFLTIKSCGKILDYIKKTQLPGKTSIHLFYLVDRLLDWMKKDSAFLCLSLFFIKLLKFEGSFLIKDHCTICKKTLQTSFIDGQAWLCEKHKTKNAFLFSKEEIDIMNKLEKEKAKDTLFKLPINKELCAKIEELFCRHFELTQGGK